MSLPIKSFNINKFISQLRDPDTDFTIIAFNDLIKYLSDEKLKEFDLPLEVIQNDFLPNVISRLSDKIPDIVNPIFRIIVLLSEKLPINSLPSFFDDIFNFVNDTECQVRNQILSVLREVLSNSISFSTERQQQIVNFFINKLNENSDIEILIFNIDVMASLLECLGFLIDETNLKHAKELITAHIEDERLEILPSVAALARIWMVVAVINDMPDQFNSMMEQLYEIGKTNSNAFTILSSMVCYRPSIYKDEAVNLISLFYERIQLEEDDLAQKLEENPEIDIYYDTPYVSHITDYISSLTSLVKTFPDKCDDEMVDNCIAILFQRYLTYGLTPSADNDDNENENENEEDEDDFIVEGGDGEVIELDEADDEIITGDDSWKIRKTAIALSIALIQCFTDKFYESLGYRDEETDCLGVVNTLIKDSDAGSQKDALDFLKVVIHYYKNELDENEVYKWFSTLQFQLTSKTSQSIASTIIETITYALNEYGNIPEEILAKIISSIQPLLNNNTIQSSIGFILTTYNTIQPTPFIVSMIASLLTDIINNSSFSSNIPYISTASKLFEYSGPIEDSITEDADCLENLGNLASSIISLCSEPQDNQTERNVQAFEALGSFISSFNKDIVNLFGNGLDIIVEAFENEISLKVICGSICLIAASTSGYDKLTPYAERIRRKLCFLLSQDITHIDNAYLSRYLWALRILLEKEIISPISNDCENVAPHLAEIFSTSDPRNILLSTSILMLMPKAAINTLEALKFSLETQSLTEQIVNNYSKLVNNCASIDIKSIETFLLSLISDQYEKERNDEIASNVASVVGYVAGNFEEILNNLLQDFEEKINDQENPLLLQFALQCIGEIGAFVDLSGRKDLVDNVFKLIDNQNREIFNTAAESIGLLSVGSVNTILPRVLKEAMKTTDSSVWILAILSMTKRLSTIDNDKLKLKGNEFETISEFLVKNADYSNPTEKSIAESFYYMIKIKPQEYIKKLINVSKSNKLGGPVATHGISLFYENKAASDDPLLLFNFIDEIMNSIDMKNPRTSEYLMLCLKICLQIIQQKQNQKQTANSQKVFEKFDPLKYFDKICTATYFDKENQVIKIETMDDQATEVDIGHNFRLNAINCLNLILSINCEIEKFDDLVDIALDVIKNDGNDEVKAQALALLTKMALNKKLSDKLYEILLIRKDIFKEIEENVSSVDILEESFLRFIVAMRITESKKIKEVEEIYLNHKDDPRTMKFESDLSYNIINVSPFAGILSSGSASFSLMKRFYPEAAIIFLI